jgi:hypothetical protein
MYDDEHEKDYVMRTQADRLTAAAQPQVVDYAHRPIEQGFDWLAIMKAAYETYELPRGTQIYLVVFPSQLQATTDRERLREMDARAHREAAASPFFLYYFAGSPDEDGYSLSFCLWRDVKHAQRVAYQSPSHRGAMALADQTGEADSMYVSYSLQRYLVRLEENDEVNIVPLRG